MNPIAEKRLSSQRLAKSSFKQAEQVVEHLGVIQAQDYSAGKWTIGLRLPNSIDASVEKAVVDRSIIRSWILRGTLHFVTPDDLRWMVKLVASKLISNNARRYRELELDGETLNRSNDVLANALQGNKQLSRPALFEVLQKHGISTEGQRGVYMLQRASLDGLICQSGVERNYPIFITIEGNIPKGRILSREESLTELARRYFISHGPASLQDFVSWSGLLISDARAGLEGAKKNLEKEEIDGIEYWSDPTLKVIKTPSPTAYLFPSYDEYWIAYKARSAIVASSDAKRVDLHNGYSPTIVVDGQVIGLWRRTIKKNKITIETTFFRDLNNAEQKAVQDACERYVAFQEMSLA
jgi:hypothetical protein